MCLHWKIKMYDTRLSLSNKEIMRFHGALKVLNVKGKIRIKPSN